MNMPSFKEVWEEIDNPACNKNTARLTYMAIETKMNEAPGTIQISRELAVDLINDVGELLAINSQADLRRYERYDKQCKIYEQEIAELKKAMGESDNPPQPGGAG